MQRRQFLNSSLAASALALANRANPWRASTGAITNFTAPSPAKCWTTISRGPFPSRACSTARASFNDNIRMLKHTGAKYIGRSICLWGGEANLLQNFDRARQQVPLVRAPIRRCCSKPASLRLSPTEVEQVPVPDWAFTALGLPGGKANFRYDAILYPPAQRTRSWGRNSGVPDVSQTETQLWFYFLAKSYIDLGFEGIHWGQVDS